ncbi:CoA-binding protein [candidate division SR1 bacterium]|nr:CoA-binding protein [candidate division SR1 bacterium]
MRISKNYTYALVGASANKEKYGNIILHDFGDNGYHIIPINPYESMIDGKHCYSSLRDIGEAVDVVIFVVKIEVVSQLLSVLLEKKVKKVWFQPGSESLEAENFCREHEIEFVSEKCIMMERRNYEVLS